MFPTVSGDTAGAPCAGISSLDATAARTMRRSWRASIPLTVQNLVYVCGVIPQSTAESSAHHRYIALNTCSNPLICPSSLPQAYNAIPFEWLKLFNRSTYLLAGHIFTLQWILRTLFKSQITTIAVGRVKTKGAKTDLVSTIWPPMTVTNESLSLQTSQCSHILLCCQ